MRPTNDRKMFAPLRRAEAVSIEATLSAIISTHQAGLTAAALAAQLASARLTVGAKAAVTARVAELLDALEQAGTVERIPDGRYRVVRSARTRERQREDRPARRPERA